MDWLIVLNLVPVISYESFASFMQIMILFFSTWFIEAGLLYWAFKPVDTYFLFFAVGMANGVTYIIGACIYLILYGNPANPIAFSTALLIIGATTLMCVLHCAFQKREKPPQKPCY
ncbi:MAG: hypothetical protein QW510_00065 [Candidatus Bathyarchaeia archaeon]